MFIRITKSKNYEYVNIVKTYRQGGKVLHKNIASLGRADLLKNDPSWEKIANKILELTKANAKIISNDDDMEELARFCWGNLVVKKLWDKFNFDEILNNLSKDKKIEFDFKKSVFKMVLDRLLVPQSKLASYQKQNRYIGIEEVELQHFYRALDVLSDIKEDLEKAIFNANCNLFNMQVNLVFYDVTTLAFESTIVDKTKNYGFSKDCKFNNVQVVFGLLIDQEGRPIGFDVFAGNTFEGKTLETALLKLKEKFNINKVIVVADRDINSKLNLSKIKEMGYDYIVGNRIRNLSKTVQDEILNEANYESINNNEETFRYKVLDHSFKAENNLICDNLVVSWSSKRALKDFYDREKFIEKAQNLIEKNPSAAKSSRGFKKYLDFEIADEVKLNEAQIEEDKKWDGYYTIQTSTKDLSPNDIMQNYHSLWKIEEAFRELKSHFKTRPIFHWTEKRITGHLVVCFIAFLLSRTLEIKLKTNEIACSCKTIKEALNNLEVSQIQTKDKIYYLKSSISPLAKDILKLMKITLPPNLTSQKSHFTNY